MDGHTQTAVPPIGYENKPIGYEIQNAHSPCAPSMCSIRRGSVSRVERGFFELFIFSAVSAPQATQDPGLTTTSTMVRAAQASPDSVGFG